MPHTVTCHDGDRLLESFEFDTEQQAMEYAIVAKRTYDFCHAGSFDNQVSVVLKRGAGRPAGTTKPDADKKRGHEITVTDEAWEKAQATGNASAYIERLIQKDNKQ